MPYGQWHMFHSKTSPLISCYKLLIPFPSQISFLDFEQRNMNSQNSSRQKTPTTQGIFSPYRPETDDNGSGRSSTAVTRTPTTRQMFSQESRTSEHGRVSNPSNSATYNAPTTRGIFYPQNCE